VLELPGFSRAPVIGPLAARIGRGAAKVKLAPVSAVVVWFIAGSSAPLRVEAIKVGLSVSAGVGAAWALLLAFRRQTHSEHVARDTIIDAAQRRVTELYARSVEQLGHDRAAVRLGGLYALERLAQDNTEQRQTVVDVVCAYLCMPLDPHSHDIPREEIRVRAAAQRLLMRHLLDPEIHIIPVQYWDGMRIDLRGADLRDAYFSDCRFHEVDFSDADFSGTAWFSAAFDGLASFEGAHFHGDANFGSTFAVEAHFDKAHFYKGASFRRTGFEDGVDFSGTIFDGDANFQSTKILYAEFEDAQFNGRVNFRNSEWGWARFVGTLFKGSEPDFTGATTDQPVKTTDWPHPWRAKPVGDTGKAQLVRRRTGRPRRKLHTVDTSENAAEGNGQND
jgi:hypothetical protein